MTIKVVAIKPGFYKGTLHREGVVFAYPKDKKLGKWMVELPDAPAPKSAPTEKGKKAKGSDPATLSELAKLDGDDQGVALV